MEQPPASQQGEQRRSPVRRSDKERSLATRNRRRARSSHELTMLFNARADLHGVSPVADFFVESVRWSA
jgi:hypothetical protein